MAETLFEGFGVPNLHIANPAVLSLLASGRETGLVVDSGEGTTKVVPVFQGTAIKPAIETSTIGGNVLTQFMRDTLLPELNQFLAQTNEFEIVKQIKEKTCYIPRNFEYEMQRFSSSSHKNLAYEMPDGSVITMKDQRIRCPEI